MTFCGIGQKHSRRSVQVISDEHIFSVCEYSGGFYYSKFLLEVHVYMYISPENNVNIIIIVSPHTGQTTSWPKSHQQKRSRMKHTEQTMYHNVFVLHPWRVVSVAGEVTTSKSVDKSIFLINDSVNLPWVIYVVLTWKEHFEMLNSKCHFFVA